MRYCSIAVIVAGVLAPSVQAQTTRSLTDDAWLGINHGAVDQTLLISDLKTVGIRMVREGFNDEPNSKFDAKINAYVDAGISCHISVNVRGAKINVEDYPTWLDNYKKRCIEIMTAYKGRVSYYIVGNEPDKRDASTGKLTPEQAVDFCRMAYEASREVDPTGGIKVESPPLSSPGPIKNYLSLMLAAGLTDHCDFIGIHAYSNQINDGRLDNPWRLEQKQGGTQKPVAVSEIGVSTDWIPKGFTPEQADQWKADFLDQAYVQLKRYGIGNVILFESSSTSKWPNTFSLLRDGSTERNMHPTSYAELQNHLKPAPLRDGGFEEPNDFKREWVVYDDPADGTWDADGFNFQADGGHDSAHALRIDNAVGTAIRGKRIVRQVVENIVPGRPVTITAWVYSNDPSGGTLKAEGYDRLAGNAETVAMSTVTGAWTQLSVTVTPTNPWVVIELSTASRKAPSDNYVKFDDVAVTR